MDSSKKSPSYADRSDADADLGLLLYKSGRSLKNGMVRIGDALSGFGRTLSLTLAFLIRNLAWILAGTALGVGYGVYLLSRNGPSYTSEMTVKANFNSTRALYNTVDYLNSLITASKTNELAKIFTLDTKSASDLESFSIEPVRSQLIEAAMYNEQFLRNDRATRIRQDTFWLRTILYPDFKEALTRYDYPYHIITAKTTNPTLFLSLEKGIYQHISNNPLLQQVKEKQISSDQDEEKLILSAIEKIDTLRRAYNERLMKGQSAATPGSNQLMLMEAAPNARTPELDLYDKMLELQDELKRVRKRSVTEKDVLEVLSPFNPVGKKVSFLDSIAKYALLGFLIPLVVLLLIMVYRWASRVQPASSSGTGNQKVHSSVNGIEQ